MTPAPVLDTEALHRLDEQLGDADMLCGFIRRYVAMLDQRIERLEHARSVQDHEDWMDAVLSLKTSSALAGARALAALATCLQEDFERRGAASSGRWPAVRSLDENMRALRGLAAETARQLRIFLRQRCVDAARST